MRTTKAMTNLVMMQPSAKPHGTDKFGMSAGRGLVRGKSSPALMLHDDGDGDDDDDDDEEERHSTPKVFSVSSRVLQLKVDKLVCSYGQ
jgi:hypothetical protein